ncbi:MAG: hypothetical protein K2Y02_03550 [Burkholderiaceae bacterium]|nr:hypothetical protein [Burkholderiaceae bacterium]
MENEPNNVRAEVLTQEQLNSLVNDLLSACGPILKHHGLLGRDEQMMQTMLLSYTVGNLIGHAAGDREQIVSAAVTNMRKGIETSGANNWLRLQLGGEATIH